MLRLTLTGSIYVTLVCLLPELLIVLKSVPFYFGGTSLLIVVGVALDTVRQMESHLLMRNYEGFLKKSRTRPSTAFGRRT
jgi:preprotein translocase subunit SecY